MNNNEKTTVKEKFEEAKIVVICFDSEDIIKTSTIPFEDEIVFPRV